MAELNESDLAVLDVLIREGRQSPTALARRTGIRATTMTGVLARLEHVGWIIRRSDKADRQGVHIEAPGIARLAAIYRLGNRRLDKIAADLPAGHARIMVDYLHAVTAAIDAATGDIDAQHRG